MDYAEQMFNQMKLPVYLEKFKNIRIGIVGGGAVGSYEAELSTKMGVGYLRVYDMDSFTIENAAKHSGIVRTPEDAGKSKALTVAERAQALMIPGGQAVGIDTDIRNLGPTAFADLDIVFVALDNFAAKELLNQLILQIPEAQRPVVCMAGTHGETAVSVLVDMRTLCLRDLFDESWLENGEIRTSCSGPQYMQLNGVSEIVRTSGLASNIAATISCEKFRAWVLGDPHVMNTRTSYTPYPNLELLDTAPMARSACPDCHGIVPPTHIHKLHGSVHTTTLRDVFQQLSNLLETEDYELRVHCLQFDGVGYGGFIREDYCHHCGKEVKVYAHEGRVHFEDVICPECSAAGHTTYYDTARPVGQVLHHFSPSLADERLLEMSLYELGFPLGSYLYVDIADEESGRTSLCFVCEDDSIILQTTTKL